MDRRTALCAMVAAGMLAIGRSAQAAPRLLVIGHRSNSQRRLDTSDLEAIFTTRKLYWPDGKTIIPFNFAARHPLRVGFDQAILHLDSDEVARFWIDRRIRGGHPPPRQIPDSATMLAIVSKLEGAVGYVTSDVVDDSVIVLSELR